MVQNNEKIKIFSSIKSISYFLYNHKNSQIQCPKCSLNSIVKKGIRKNKLQSVQQYQCKSCKCIFTQNKSKNTTYSITTILKSVSHYNLGYNLKQTKEKLNIEATLPAISSWLKKYKEICTFSRLRSQAIKLYNPETNKPYTPKTNKPYTPKTNKPYTPKTNKPYTPQNMLHIQTLNHIQPYTFKYHKAKLDILLKENQQFAILRDYISKINSKDFPHHIFTYNSKGNANANKQRASQLKFSHLNIKIINKTNQSNELAKLALNLAKSNNDRHSAIQDFMLINDSVTIATEVPVYLTNWDAGYYRNQKGFIFPLNNYPTPITGHIDILQIRNGLIHILDYKPDANKAKPIEQLTIYALSLSRKLNLPLHSFKCAWFDEQSYYEFYPLHAVYERR